MKMRTRVLCVLLTILIASFPILALAHSGRTDASGGHKDNKNASGLGSYHYHHGYPAHLHPNGVCPYGQSAVSSNNTSTPASSQSSSTKSVSKPSFPVVVNGTNLNLTTSSYYPVVIDNVTYVPLTSEVIESLKLSGGWDSTSGLVLKSK